MSRSDGWWWITNSRMTVAVKVQDGLVVEGPPIVRKFLGQPARNLGGWMRKASGFEVRRLQNG